MKIKKGYCPKPLLSAWMGEVYLWISKVSIGDDLANERPEIAKTHLQNVLSNYGLKMLDDFSSVFDAKNGKGNSEIIFAVRYAEGEAN
ncbi:RagB/SusD family nutrient uptake outer membrane protein [Bacteroides fragilis]|nr:RagB/SusD family nutrient uptake outer membrane protein [Bacteroides fragilis]